MSAQTDGDSSMPLEAEDDSTVIMLQEIEVVATTPISAKSSATTQLSSREIRQSDYGQDMPTLLMFTPSVVTVNESGIGIGSTSMRIRGTDATRISVTMNGMSLNNPDSRSMYWYDTPDLAGATGSIRIIRGAGTTTNGTGAFGGAIDMSSANLQRQFGGDAMMSYGSYNTNKQSAHICSGLMGNHWIIDARLSHIGSDGYIDRAKTNMGSYMLQTAYIMDNSLLKLVSFGGKSKTYLTYTGATPEEIATYGRKYHTSGQYTCSDGPFALIDGTHVNYYDDQTDNYMQFNNQLIYDNFLDGRWDLNAMIYYNYGNGYYNQYKDDAWLMSYDYVVETPNQADLIRHKKMTSHTGGANLNAIFSISELELRFGAAYSIYGSPHYGTISWIDGMDKSAFEGFKWYDNNARKHDGNIYVKAAYKPVMGLVIDGEAQYRIVRYHVWGSNDNYDWNRGEMQKIDVNKLWNFFNCNLGIDYSFAKWHGIAGGFAMTNLEPTRADFTDRYNFSTVTEEPLPERLYDFELSYRFVHEMAQASINLYYMKYYNQLVPTGIVNDSEDNLNMNVKDSYRRGIELTVSVDPLKWMKIGTSWTLSQNRILNFDEVIGDQTFHHDNVDIAYSPSVTGYGFIDFHTHGFQGIVKVQYVGKQYISNGGHEDLSLPGYCVGTIDLGYRFAIPHSSTSLRLGVQINNFTNTLYSSYGYGGSYMDDGERKSWSYLFPQAPCNAMGSISVIF